MKRTAVETKTASISFPPNFLTDLRSRSSIEEVVGDYVKLKKQGKGLSGVCPFHTENTPSFHVSPSKKLFHCFGCGKGGDIFTFIQEKEGLSFIESVMYLADRYGIDIPKSAVSEEYEKIASLQDKLVRINKKALEHFRAQLEINDEIKNYLRKREISEKTENIFQLGYAPEEWNNLKNKLKEDYSNEDIRATGLFSDNKDDTGYYDLFRSRIIIPIFDVRGRVIAFGGRVLEGGKAYKYINSPETPLYVKGNHLYGLHQTKEEIRKKGFAILTEGYFDLISLYEKGITNVVASLGTSLTENQAKLLRKYTDKVVICYDGDEAGLSAAERVSEILIQEGFTIKVMVLPDKADPDDYIRKFGKKTFSERRQQSDNWFKFRIQRIKAKTNMSNPTEKARAVEEVLDIISKCPTDIEKYGYFEEAMRFMKVDSRIAAKLSKKLGVNDKKVKASEMVVKPTNAETRFLELLVCNDESRIKYADGLNEWTTNLSITPIVDAITINGELDYTELEQILSSEEVKILRESIVKSEETLSTCVDSLEEELSSCINAIARLVTETQLEDLSKQIKFETDENKLFDLLDEQSELLTTLDCLNS